MNRHKNWLLFAVSLMALMINIDYTAVNLALVPIAAQLNAHIDTIQWVLSGYVLAWAALVIPGGKLVDRYGARQMCIIGLCIFLLGSMVTGMANSPALLISGRIIQGIAGAFYVPTLYGLIFTYFPHEKRGAATGILSLGVGVGMAIGPTFGGLILTWLTWRWIFFINIPITVSAMFIILSCCERVAINQQQTLNKLNSLLLALAISSIMYLLNQGIETGIFSWEFLGLMLFAIITAGLFVYRQSRSDNPLINWSLFKNKPYLGTILATGLEQFSFSTFIIMLALFLQKVKDKSSLYTSVIFLATTLIFGVSSPLGGKLVDRVGMRPIAVNGLLVFAVATIGFACMTSFTPLWIILLMLIVTGLGMGFAFSALNTGVVTTVNAQQMGLASSVFLLMALLGNTMGVLLSSFIYEFTSKQYLIDYAQQHITTTLSHLQLTQLKQSITLIGVSHHNFDAFTTSMQKILSTSMHAAQTYGIATALWVSAAALIISMSLVGFLVNRKSILSTENKSEGNCIL